MPLTLALLVLRVLADHTQDPPAPDNLAMGANLFNRTSNLHRLSFFLELLVTLPIKSEGLCSGNSIIDHSTDGIICTGM